jgi:hypothetical protein
MMYFLTGFWAMQHKAIAVEMRTRWYHQFLLKLIVFLELISWIAQFFERQAPRFMSFFRQ